MNNPQPHILLTGGTGLIGTGLTDALLAKGYQVSHLSRSPGKDPRVKTFLWDVPKGNIDPDCITGVDVIVHLAGTGVADKRWTDNRKQEIVKSRVDSIKLIYELLKRKPHQVKRVISSSGVNYYGDNGDVILTETHPAAKDFLGQCCVAWEAAVDEAKGLGVETVKLRTGVVLTQKGGALPQMAMPTKLGVGSPLGSGKQWVPWIHYADAIGIYMYAIEQNKLTGAYNMVAPQPVTNAQLTSAIAKQIKRPLWAPKVPAFVMKLIMGEMASVVLDSVRASAEKVEADGYKFQYPEINEALRNIYEPSH